MSECSCVYVEHEDSCDFYYTKVIKARQKYRCYECGKVIDKGEQYEMADSVYDGAWAHHRTCADCLSVRESLFCGSYCHGSIWYDLREHIDYCFGNIDLNKLIGLTPAARVKVCEMIEDAWEKYLDD